MRNDVRIPETKIKCFINEVSKIFANLQKYSIDAIKTFLDEKHIPVSDNATADLINNLYVPNPFASVETFDSTMSFLEYKAKCSLPQPCEILLGKTKMIKKVPLVPKNKKIVSRRLQPNNYVLQSWFIKDTAHYISIIDTLKIIMRNPKAREAVRKENPKYNGTIYSYKDAQQFQKHAYFEKYPYALRLSLHLDDVEVLNPLGSRKTNQKVTVFSFKIQNMHPALNACLSRICNPCCSRKKK